MARMRQLIEGLQGVVAEAVVGKKPRKRTSMMTAGQSVKDFQKGVKDFQARNAYHGSHFKGEPVFKGAVEGYKPKAARKGKDVGGEATMPGPGGDVAGRWVTVKGKRLFFPDKPGGDVPEGPWGGAPFRPGWAGKGGKFRAGRGVMPQKGQLGLPGLKRGKKKHEASTYGGRRLSEALAGIVGGILAEYKTPGWSTTPSGKGGKVWNVKPPGKKGVWRTVGGKHVFYPQDGSGPWGGAPFRPGWTKKSGKFRPTAKKGVKAKGAKR